VLADSVIRKAVCAGWVLYGGSPLFFETRKGDT
jgi:hypothetical protein